MPRNENAPDVAYKQFNVAVSFDDTHTRARVFTSNVIGGEDVVAEGKAKRRKGDVRNVEAGIALAVGRAFTNLGERELAVAEAKLEDG